MAFGRKKRKSSKNLVIAFLILLMIIGLSCSGYYLHYREMNGVVASYEQDIREIKKEQDSFKEIVLVANVDMKTGEKITADKVTVEEIVTSLDKKQYLDFNHIQGRLLVDIEKGTPLLNTMTTVEVLPSEVREQELSMLMLPTNLESYEYVDVRINFPTGEDYIVLSKKRVEEINQLSNTVWFWLKEKEILTLSSAIVDAYVHEGTKLYVLKYVEPSLQEASVVNYPVNEDVKSLIIDNPNIVNEAIDSLSEGARQILEERLASIDHLKTQNIASGIINEEQTRSEVAVSQNGRLDEASQSIQNEEIIDSNKGENGSANTLINNGKEDEDESKPFF